MGSYYDNGYEISPIAKARQGAFFILNAGLGVTFTPGNTLNAFFTLGSTPGTTSVRSSTFRGFT